MMKNILFKMTCTIAIFSISTNIAVGANIVYPKSDNVTINSPETFFIGSENPESTLKINEECVEIHPSGGFWHTVNLNYGENVFKIDNGSEVKSFKIYRPEQLSKNSIAETIVTYDKPVLVETKTDNVPLRATPIDGGINRLQHFTKGMKFTVIGEYNNFYKVKLGRDDYAYISKDSTIKLADNKIKLSEIQAFSYSEDINKRIFKLKLNERTPYILSESSGLDLVVYNVKNYPYNKYEFHINKTGKMFGYTSFYNDENELVIEVNNQPNCNCELPLKDIKITIDPGHGGNESGAIGCLGDKEKDINLAIAKKLENKLKDAGAMVYMTRDEDIDVSLSDRVEFSNKNKSLIFLSIHNNALPDSLAHLKSTGTEIYYFYPQSKELAKTVLESITDKLGTKNNGVKQQSFAVVRNTNNLSILIEIAYIINPEDNAKLIEEDFQDAAAEAILNGLENYLK